MASILSELQFCQLENEVLKSQVRQNKLDLQAIRWNINILFKEIECTFSGYLEDGAIRLTQEDRKKVLEFIDAELNKK